MQMTRFIVGSFGGKTSRWWVMWDFSLLLPDSGLDRSLLRDFY
jgi:hypothetical protein